MSGPRVSVIIPCYNLDAYLDEAVRSVLAQTLQDFEIIVVNDGSTDPETNRLLTEYRRPRTQVLATAENRGLPAARNLAIGHATGEYLCALDADDTLDPAFFAKAVPLLDADPALAFVSCWLRGFGGEPWVWRQDRCDLATLLAECTVCTAALVRRALVLECGGYDTAMPTPGDEDWDLWISLVERGHRGVILPEVLFQYRQRPGSMSTALRGETHVRVMEYLIRKHEAAYRRHLPDVLRRKAIDLERALRVNYGFERTLECELEQQIRSSREELARLRAKLEGGVPARGAGATPLEEALRSARREIAELRRSWSWRLTAPGRAAYDLLRRLGGRGAGSR